MSDRRPSPAGVRVSAGRLRVDAARAVDKLRDYQLPDPIMWVLEVVRAAVLARAESIRVYGDADDVAIAWEGEPIDPEDLARLLDELVDPAPAADRRHLRLLATGVNTALGLAPRWIDVVSCDGTGEAHAVRYTTRLLEQKGESGATGLRDLTAERRGAVPHAPARGVLVHLRRPPLLSAVPILIGLGEPAELSMLRRAAVDLNVPLSIGRSVLGRDRSHVDLLRIELGEGLEGFLALTDPTFAEDEGGLDVAELGVLLARYTLPLLPGGAKPRARVPLRLFVDAERMPTNASRSAVRLEDPPVCDVIARAPALLGALTTRLAAELTAPTHTWTPTQGERLRAAALSLLAVAVAGQTWREELAVIASSAYGKALAKLASLPLLRDALGRARAPSSFAPRHGDMHVHFGADPLPSALEPWLGDVLWVPPGDPSIVLLGGWRAPPAQELAARARELERARALWLREKPRPATLADDPLHLLAVPIQRPGDSLKSCVPAALFVGGAKGRGEVSGQLALCDPRGTRTSRVSLLIEGREIESLTLELPVPIVAVLEHTGLRPSSDYRSAARDEAFDAALAAVRAAAVVACEALALRMDGKSARGDRAVVRAPWLASADPSERAILSELNRGGAMLALSLPGSSLEKSRSPLLTAEVWSLATGEAKCLREIFAAIGIAPRVLRWSRARSAHRPPPGATPVFVLSPDEQAAIARVAKPSTTVDYTPIVAAWAPEDMKAMPGGAACRVGAEGEAVIGWWTLRGKIFVHHWGRRVAELALPPELSACHVRVEDGRAVPGEGGKGTRGAAPGPYPVGAWHRQLATAYIDALAGSPPPELTVFTDDPLDATFARAGLLEAIASAPLAPVSWLGTDRVRTLRRIRWISVLGEPDPISLDALSARFPEGPIPYVPPATHAPPGLEWHPARATAIEASAFARLLERELTPAVDRLADLVRLARRQEALEKLRRERVVKHSDGWSGPRVELRGERIVSAVCALGMGDRAQVEVRLEGRRFASLTLEVALPVRLDVDFDERAADEDLRELTIGARIALVELTARGARRLLQSIARRNPSSLTTAPGVLALLVAWSKTIEARAAERKLASELLTVPAFASIQGGPLVSLESALSASGALRVATWDEPWVGPAEGERPSAYDDPIVRLGSSVDRALLGALHPGGLQDVSGPAGKLQTERRIARGLVKLARLEGVKDPRFRYPLAELLAEADEASELLGFGEAALDDAERSVVTLFASGVQRKVLDFALVPAVRVAAESPLVRSGQPLAPEVEDKLADAVRMVIARLVRRVVDTTPPDQLPEWVRHTLRASCLSGGALHFERLDATPMFKTTAGGWLTPADLRAQHAILGPIWWTAAALPLAPLDPARVALRLRRDEAKQLEKWLPCMDAQAELELDATARANRDRWPVESLEPTEAERAGALAVIELGAEPDDPCHGVIVVLRPGHEGRRGVRMHRAMRPLGVLPDPCAWPALARLEDPDLVPNRTWAAPEESPRLFTLRARVSEAVRKELIRRVPYPRGKHHARRISNARVLGLARYASVEAVVWLEESLGAGTLAVYDARGERTIEPSHQGRPLPLSGTVWMADALVDGAVTTALYRFLLEQAARDVPAEPTEADLPLAHLVHGLGLGLVDRGWLPPLALPCFAPEPWPLYSFLAALDTGARVPVAALAERGAASASEVPVLIDDGAPLSRALIGTLGARACPWREALRASVLEEPGPMLGGAADPRPAASPQSALERRLEARLATSSPLARVKVAARRKKPLLATEEGTLVLAGAHPIVARLRALAETDDPRLDLALTLLAARIAGHQHRVAARIGPSGELDAMLRLLESTSEAK